MSENKWLARHRAQVAQHAKNDGSNKEKSAFAQLLALLNSPVIVTLIGGLLIASVTSNWQAQEALLRRKETTMVKFADQFGKILTLLPTRKFQEITLRDLIRDAEKPSKDAGEVKARAQAVKDAEARYDAADLRVLALEDSIALTSQVRAVYRARIIDEKCEELDKLIDRIGTTSSLDNALMMHESAIATYRIIVREMGREMRESS